MPCVIQPGGGGEKICVHYTAHRKHGLVAALKRMQAEGMRLRVTASELRVRLQGVGKIDRLDKILRSKKKVALTGTVSQLKAIKDALLQYLQAP